MEHDEPRFGIWFWLLAGGLLAASMSCFAFAANLQGAATDTTSINSVADALRQQENPRIRLGVMTERLQSGSMIERVHPDAIVVAEGEQ